MPNNGMTIARQLTKFAILFILVTCAYSLLDAQVRRGVLVGIDDYRPYEGVSSAASRREWRNLRGTGNDVASMKGVLIGRFGFEEKNLLVLANREATRQAILSAIEQHLIHAAAKGDVCLFYFAGHGSQICNRYSTEPDRMDETLVPSDWYLHGDIRDKELKILFNKILDKKAQLTVIIDACHSGSISRGIPAAVEYRALPPLVEIVSDARQAPDPVERGALVLSAAQDFEVAREKEFEQNRYHGIFSWALNRVLTSVPIDEPANHILMRVNALMQSEGCNLTSPSTPNLELRSAGSNKTLFGIPAGSRATVNATVLHVHRTLVTLQGSIAAGIHNGCRLKKIDRANKPDQPVIEVFRSLGLDSCQAKVIEGSPQTIQPGDFFEIHRWAAPPETRMKIWMPPCPLTQADILQTAKAARAGIGHSDTIQWVDDPTEINPTHIMSWNKDCWQIKSSDSAIPLSGDRPSTPHILQALHTLRRPTEKIARFFLRLPVDDHTRTNIESHIAFFKDAVEPIFSSLNAHYILTGRYKNGNIEYSWLLPNKTANQSHNSLLPIRTGWQTAISLETLSAHLLRLVKIRAWHQLPSPPDANRFPYHLSLRNLKPGETYKNQPLVEGEEYRLALQKQSLCPNPTTTKRYIYIFVIDSQGTGTLLFPSLKRKNSENHFPQEENARQKQIDLGNETAFKVRAPFGTDTFFLLTTEAAIANPEVLDFNGVYRAYQIPERYSPLERLLYGLGSGARHRPDVTPISWSIQRLPLQSLPKSRD